MEDGTKEKMKTYHAEYDPVVQNSEREREPSRDDIANLSMAVRVAIPAAKKVSNEALQTLCYRALKNNRHNDLKYLKTQLDELCLENLGQDLSTASVSAENKEPGVVQPKVVESKPKEVEIKPSVAPHETNSDTENVPAALHTNEVTDIQARSEKPDPLSEIVPTPSLIIQTQEDLEQVVECHKAWCRAVLSPKFGFDGGRANLNGAQISGMDLVGADLRGASFKKSICQNTLFRQARLNGVDFSGADLSQADFTEADLRRATLEGAELEEAIFKGAKVEGVIAPAKTIEWLKEKACMQSSDSNS